MPATSLELRAASEWNSPAEMTYTQSCPGNTIRTLLRIGVAPSMGTLGTWALAVSVFAAPGPKESSRQPPALLYHLAAAFICVRYRGFFIFALAKTCETGGAPLSWNTHLWDAQSPPRPRQGLPGLQDGV
ncbi:unnamed protein product [Eretmochelys imbricata]